MTDYDNTNRGVLFPNDRKEKDTQPDQKGSLNVEGVDYWLSGWVKVTKDGEEIISLSIKKKDAPKSNAWEQQREKFGKKPDVVIEDISGESISLDDIPF